MVSFIYFNVCQLSVVTLQTFLRSRVTHVCWQYKDENCGCVRVQAYVQGENLLRAHI